MFDNCFLTMYCLEAYPIWFSTISLSTSPISRPAALTCCGMNDVGVIPGVVLISSMLILYYPSVVLLMI